MNWLSLPLDVGEARIPTAGEVKRYEPAIYIAQPPTWMRESLDYGDYVKWRDYQAAIAERDAAQRDLQAANEAIRKMQERIIQAAVVESLQALLESLQALLEATNRI